jgi:hypothetical protein
MRLEGTLDFEQRRAQRWVPIVAIVIPVFLFVAGVSWFIRAFIAPPMATIPAATIVAAAPPPEPPMPSEPLPQEAQDGRRAVLAFAGRIEPALPATLPMFATFTIAPPSVSLRTAPPATIDSPATGEPEPSAASLPAQEDEPASAPATPSPSSDIVASLPRDAPDNPAMSVSAAVQETEPIAGPIPLPLPRPISALPSESQVPVPRTRPEAETTSATSDAERRAFAAHGAE